jgi:hypothetical protein
MHILRGMKWIDDGPHAAQASPARMGWGAGEVCPQGTG